MKKVKFAHYYILWYNTAMQKTVIPLIVVSVVLVSAGLLRAASQDPAVAYHFEPTPLPRTTVFPLAETTPVRGEARTFLQAAAYTTFRELFGDAEPRLIEPVEDFRERAVFKQFGTFITPDESPVAGERFSGYHTGVDAEFPGAAAHIPVVAISDGTIVYRGWVNGYGGVIIIRHIIEAQSVLVLYGHTDPESFPPATVRQVSAGTQIAVLGDSQSHATDGGRRHLHLSIRPNGKLDFRGYVETEEELKAWLNPLDFYQD